jgi:hypothetical protein
MAHNFTKSDITTVHQFLLPISVMGHNLETLPYTITTNEVMNHWVISRKVIINFKSCKWKVNIVIIHRWFI